MAAPVIAATNTSTGASGTSHTVNLPSGIVAGNTIVVVFGGSAAATLTWPAGWSQFLNGGATGATLNAAYRLADGTEGSTISVSSGATSITSNHKSYCITGAEGSAPQAGSNVTVSNSATGDPPSLSPTWGTMDTLWLAISFASTQTVVNTFPTSYSNGAVVTNGSTGLATCDRSNTVSAENPAAYTWAGTGRKNSNTISIKPGTPIVPAVATLTATGTTSRPVQGNVIATTAGALAIAGTIPLIINPVLITPLVGSLSLSGGTPTLITNFSRGPPVATLTITGNAPAVVQGTVITPSVGALVATGNAPSVVQGTIRTPFVGSLSAPGQLSNPNPLIYMGAITMPNSSNSTVSVFCPFAAKALIFSSSYDFSWNNGTSSTLVYQFGVAAGTTTSKQWSRAAIYEDNIDNVTSVPGHNRYVDDACINIIGIADIGGGSLFYVNRITAVVDSITSTGFNLNVTVDTSIPYSGLPNPVSPIVYFMAIGGDAVQADAGVSGTGNIGSNIDVTGLSFKPTFELFCCPEISNKVIESPINIGAGTSSSNRFHLTAYGTDLSNVSKGRTESRTNAIIRTVNEADSTRVMLDLVSQNYDGFTYSVDPSSNSGTSLGWLAIGGNVLVDIGQLTQPTSNGDQDITSTVKAEGLLLFGDSKAAHTDLSSTYTPTIGMAVPGLNNISIAYWLDNGVNPTDNAQRKDNTNSLLAVASNTATVQARGLITQANSPNGWRINWDTTDSTQRVWNYIAIQIKNSFLASSGSLSLTGYAPTLVTDFRLQPATGTVTVTGNPPPGSGASEITPIVGIVTFGTDAPTLIINFIRGPPVVDLALTGYAPTLSVSVSYNGRARRWAYLFFDDDLAGFRQAAVTTANTNITPSVGTLTIIGNAPSVVQGTVITPDASSLALSGNAPVVVQGTVITPSSGSLSLNGGTLVLDLGITPNPGSITITGNAPSLLTGNAITPSAGSLTLNGQTPVTITDFRITPFTGQLAINGQQAAIAESTVLTPGTGTLTVLGNQPGIVQGTVITPDTGSLTLTGNTPGVVQSIVITPSAGALVISGNASALILGNAIQPGVGTLAFNGNNPTVKTDFFITPNAGELILQGQDAANLQPGQIQPSPESLDINGQAPVLITDFRITPSAGSLDAIGQAPVVSQGTVIIPSTGSLSINGNQPIEDLGIIPSTGDLSLVGYQPSVEISSASNTNITPGVGTLSITGQTPALTQGTVITPSTGSLTLSGNPCTASTGTNTTCNAGTLSISGNQPGVVQGTVITPGTGSLSISGNPPVLIQGTIITPSTGTLTINGNTPEIQASVSITPNTGTLTINGNPPTIGGNTALRPDAGTLSIDGNQPILVVGTVITPSTGTLSLSGNAPAVLIDIRITPNIGTLSINGQSSVTRQDYRVTPNTGTLSINGQSVAIAESIVITPDTGTVTIEGTTPDQQFSYTITPGTGTLTIDGRIPIVNSTGIELIYQVVTYLATEYSVEVALALEVEVIASIAGFEVEVELL